MKELEFWDFYHTTVDKVVTLLDTNDSRVRPWGRKDFIMYILGVCEMYKFLSGEDFDANTVMSNIVIDSGVLDKLPPEK